MLNTPEFKVGLLVLVVSGIVATMSLKVSEDPSYLGTSKRSFFLLEDATGLVKSSPVYVAGIRVGVIKDITLLNDKARVEVILKQDVPLYTSARVEIRAAGILGDKNVVVVPGDPRDPPLQDGGQILVVDDRASVDRLISEVSKITDSLSQVAENIKSATEGDDSKPLGQIIKNIETITRDVSEITRDNKEQVNDIITRINRITETLDGFVNDESDDGFKAAWRDAMSSLQNVEKTLTNFEEISDKINRGEGTIGRLVNDEETVEELNTAISGINNFIDAGQKLQTSLDFHSYYLTGDDAFKSFLGVKVQPGLDRYYLLQVVDDPEGLRDRTDITTVTDGGAPSVQQRTELFRDRVRLTALFAKNFQNITLKGGVIENTGGAGIDVHLLSRKLTWTTEAFDFTNLHFRSSLRYDLTKGIYLIGGIDDAFPQEGDQVNGFIGAGIFLTNDDLKVLLSELPF